MSEPSSASYVFVYYIFAPLIFAIGMLGNLMGLLVANRSLPLKKNTPCDMYIYLFASDTVFLVQIVVNYLQYGFNLDLTFVNKYTCKLFWYINYTSDMMSPLILIYISVEKLVSTKWPAKRFLLRNRTNQLFYLLVIIVYNSLYYLPVVYFFEITNQQLNASNQFEPMCAFKSLNYQKIINFMDMTNRVLVPFFIMSFLSLFLLISIIRLRVRVAQIFLAKNTKSLRRDIKSTASLIFLNIVYVSFSLPLSVATNFSFSDFYFVLTFYCLYIIYGINFYLIILSNSLFRKEFYNLFMPKSFSKTKVRSLD